ncbi:TPA: acylneuraminate cytidylyltransferase family protein [Enterococcus faecium]|uniref:acylneuraminate cytidylyltransferase family protein n=1 Tax=Enterococcus faecium TaxID=1352 RepID=UPI00032F4DDD|nr:acylneuraminate cytidylyltransferase family protein [Enterococcus faecium]EOF54303.1 N-acylneuraminate cytidylyltransferase [Enterococcus faecium EnGen0131]MCU4679180.1 acylneuraminate cytidylyltransferase family protein [Enterococcus faecium]MDT2332757.1 acylneuraminate cytidylyltransferase family protein [Enterococcus faecium]MDT2362951.1 acylneuraminate cytidylyltransferase family protein [Enterococcus faecium]MDV7755930.1 acylneuraminate cytidylyltransferase family protein [Enterococcus
MNILFTICGRAGSKGLKNKNLKSLAGKPLVGYAISLIHLFKENHPEFNCVIGLNTDSNELKEITKQLDSEIILVDRKDQLATDTVGKIEVIRDTYLAINNDSIAFDLIVDLDITSPLRELSDLENLVQNHIDDIDKDIYFSVVPARRNPYFNMVKNYNNQISIVNQSNYTSRQQAPEVYDMNASMYSFKPDFLKEHTYIFDGKCGIIEMKDYLILDIDSEEDFEWLEFLMPKFLKDSDALQLVHQN